jgi:hypothetical protein
MKLHSLLLSLSLELAFIACLCLGSVSGGTSKEFY